MVCFERRKSRNTFGSHTQGRRGGGKGGGFGGWGFGGGGGEGGGGGGEERDIYIFMVEGG